jgi:phosphatidylglycerophosphate synthase
MTHKTPHRKNIFEHFYNQISKPFSIILAKTWLTPNQITIISGVFGFYGAYLLTKGQYIDLLYGAIFIQLYTILDLVDGDIARMKNLQSNFGKWLDIIFDKLNDFFIILGLSVGVYLRSGEVVYLYLGIVLMGASFFIQFFMIMNKNIYNDIESNFDIRISTPKEGLIINLASDKFKLFNNIRCFISTHFMLEHSTFLFLVSFFCILNMAQLALWFLAVHSIISIIYTTMHAGFRIFLLESRYKG